MIDQVVLVDEKDNPLGLEEKWKAHEGQGILHRAFSVWVFNNNWETILQRRSHKKKLWPMYWANSYCSHPRQNERYEGASARRAIEELGMQLKPKIITRFQYQSNYQEKGQLIGSEHELCTILYNVTQQKPKPNKEEIAEIRYITLNQLQEDIQKNPEIYTPWLKKELPLILNYLKGRITPSEK